MIHFDDLIVLIPSHSLEDFPTELSDDEAAGLLNSFQVPWHPRLLAAAGVMPRWQRADEPVEVLEDRLIVIPSVCDPLVAAGWPERAARDGALVIRGTKDRSEMLATALAGFEEESREVDPELAADFLALGFGYLQLELLTRHMRQFSHLDESHFSRELLAGAEAAVAGDQEKATTHLGNCYDVLYEARERFYPVDAYLVDLCLVDASAAEKLGEHLDAGPPVNLLLSGKAVEELAASSPAMLERIRDAWQAGQAEVCGGEYDEAPSFVLPLESILWQFSRGAESYRRHLRRPPRTFARRRYGLFPQLPQILARFGFTGALHLALDDGAFPTPEQGKVRWEAPSGQIVDALTSIPLPADAPATYLRFPSVMADSMSREHVATVGLAHWAGVKAPWYHDLRRIARYVPLLGKFVTLADYFEGSESPGMVSEFKADEYRSPYLFESVYRHEPDPVSRWVRHYKRRQCLDATSTIESLTALVEGSTNADAIENAEGIDSLAERLEACSPETQAGAACEVGWAITEAAQAADKELAKRILASSGGSEGLLLINPLSASRRVAIEVPEIDEPLPLEAPVSACQVGDPGRYVVADVPAMGFAWIPRTASTAKPTPQKPVPLVEDTTLRNEYCEVEVDPETGGVREIHDYQQRTMRIGQQVAMLMRSGPSVRGGASAGVSVDVYSRMVAREVNVTSSGPALGEIVTEGDLLEPEGDQRLAGFRQRLRLWKGRPVLEIELTLEIDRMPEGNPWQSYYAARFAWPDPESALTRSVTMGATATADRRWECPHYVEIGSGRQRTTILTGGLPFLRRHGDRMADLLLVCEGETTRTFRFGIGIDLAYPIPAAFDFLEPIHQVATATGPPITGPMGWFFHLDAKNVVVTRVSPAKEPETISGSEQRQVRPRVMFDMIETEGRPVRARLRCLRKPKKARQVDFRGSTLSEPGVADDAVVIDLTAHEIARVVVEF